MANKFKFRLEKVREYKTQLKKESELELVQRNNQLLTESEKMAAILHSQDNATLPSEGVMSMAELMLNKEYHQFLQEALVEQRLQVEAATQAVEEAMEIYTEKAKEVKTLDVLKAKRKEEFDTEKSKEEKKTSDKLVVMRHRFNKPDI
jgi:flagellar FliJ protein